MLLDFINSFENSLYRFLLIQEMTFITGVPEQYIKNDTSSSFDERSYNFYDEPFISEYPLVFGDEINVPDFLPAGPLYLELNDNMFDRVNELFDENNISYRTNKNEIQQLKSNGPAKIIEKISFTVVFEDQLSTEIVFTRNGENEKKTIIITPQQKIQSETGTLDDYLYLATMVARFPWLYDHINLPLYDRQDQTDHELIQSIPRFQRRNFFNRIILGRKPSLGLRLLDHAGLLQVFLPEITAGKNLTQNRFHAYDIYEHCLHAVDGVIRPDKTLRWSALLHDIGKTATRREMANGEATFHNHEVVSAKQVVTIMKRLGIPRITGERVKFLVRNHMFHYTNEWTDKAVRRFIRKISHTDLKDLIDLRLADRVGSGKKSVLPSALKKLVNHIREVETKDAELKVHDLAIGGHDLMKLGMQPGPEMGGLLNELLEEVKQENIQNTQKDLLDKARELMTENTAT